MELEIKHNENEIIVKFKNEKLSIAEHSESWNNEGISRFLTNLAVHTPDQEVIEIKFDDKDESPIYKHICSLFKSFADEYNQQKQEL